MPRMGGYVPASHAESHQDGGSDEISIADLAGTPTELATHEADIDAHMSDLFQRLKTEEYAYPWLSLGSNLTAIVADNLYAIPWLVARPLTITHLAIQVTTEAASGKKARLGIYSNGENNTPGTLLIDAGLVDIDAVAVVAVACAQAIATPGLYWLAILPEANITVKGFVAAFSCMGIKATDFDAPNCRYNNAEPFGALPTPFPTPLTVGQAPPWILPKIGSLD